jgi:hypothetical protein
VARRRKEPIPEPELPITDPHHDLWQRPGRWYLVEDLLLDTGSGHNIDATVYMEGAFRRRDDPLQTFWADPSSLPLPRRSLRGASPITPPRRMPWRLEVAHVRAPEGTLIGFSEPPPTTMI